MRWFGRRYGWYRLRNVSEKFKHVLQRCGIILCLKEHVSVDHLMNYRLEELEYIRRPGKHLLRGKSSCVHREEDHWEIVIIEQIRGG